jgi:uncharacterized membrane protein
VFDTFIFTAYTITPLVPWLTFAAAMTGVVNVIAGAAMALPADSTVNKANTGSSV